MSQSSAEVLNSWLDRAKLKLNTYTSEMEKAETGKSFIGYLMLEEKENDIVKLGEQLLDGFDKPKAADILAQVEPRLSEVDLSFDMGVIQDVKQRFFRIKKKGEFEDEFDEEHNNHHLVSSD